MLAWRRAARYRVPALARRADAGDGPGGHMTVLLSRTPGRSHDREEISPGYALIVYLVKIVFAIMARPGTGGVNGRGRQGTRPVTGLLLPGAGGAGPGGWHANRAHRAGAPITPGTQSCDSLVYALIA